jgi:RNA polymerase sigma factor (sigma-70 family)
VRDGDREDLDLHRRLASGDRGAFDDLYRRYSGPAYGLAFRVTGQQILAQDVVHDAFLALWRAPEAYDPVRGPFRTFFLALVHHRAVAKRSARPSRASPPNNDRCSRWRTSEARHRSRSQTSSRSRSEP